VFSSVSQRPCRIPLSPRSEARIQVLVYSYGVPAHICGHQPTSDFPFLIAWPVDFKHQHQMQRQQPYGDHLTSSYNCISQVPETNSLFLLLWLNPDWHGHCFHHDDTDKVISSHLVARSSTSMEKNQRASKRLYKWLRNFKATDNEDDD